MTSTTNAPSFGDLVRVEQRRGRGRARRRRQWTDAEEGGVGVDLAAAGLELLDQRLHRVDRDGEADVLRPRRMMAVLMPTTSPSALTSGPPELPGLMAASVWMRCSRRPPAVVDRAVLGRDDAAGDARLAAEVEGVADGDHVVADLRARRTTRAWPARGRSRSLDPDHGDVVVGEAADQLGVGGRAVVRTRPRIGRRPAITWSLVSDRARRR